MRQPITRFAALSLGRFGPGRGLLVAVMVALLLAQAHIIFSAPGDLDTSFGDGGVVVTDFGGVDVAGDVLVQANGKIVLAGGRYDNDTTTTIAVRYLSDGSLDPDFGAGGVFTTTTFAGAEMQLQADGKIVRTGYVEGDTQTDIAVARFNTDGSFDTSFAGDGLAAVPIASDNVLGTDVVIQPDGKIVIVGTGDQNPIVLARFHPDGTKDNSFGNNGIVLDDSAIATSLTLQPDGKIVVTGRNTGYFVTTRYNADGTLDTGFGSDGTVWTDVGTGTFVAPSDVDVQDDGKIVVSGDAYVGDGGPYDYEFCVVRYHSDGSLDNSFAGDGIFRHNPDDSSNEAFDTVVRPGNGLFVAGYDSNGFVLLALRADGTLDTDFNGSGIVTPGVSGRAHALAVQADGRILLAGYTNFDFAIARLLGEEPISYDEAVYLPLVANE